MVANDIGLTEASPARQEIRRATAGSRPQTSHRRLDTARPETSTSSVGEIPQQTFFADNDEDDDNGLGEVYESEEDDDHDVFAFERPQTAAVAGPLAANQQAFAGRVDGANFPKPIVRLATSKSRVPTTADTRRSVSFGYDIDNQPDQVDSMGNLSHLAYGSTQQCPPMQNLNASAYKVRGENWETQRPSVVSATLVGIPSTAHTKDSRVSPDHGQHSSKSIDDYASSQVELPDDQSLQDAIELAAYRRRPGTQVSWNLSELHGATTIPDGVTTKGDGLGGLDRKWVDGNDNSNQGRNETGPLEQDSPFPEVRASVSNIDDPDLPVLTIRSGSIGLVFAIIGAGINTFFSFRGPGPVILPLAAQILAYPIGRFMAWALPLHTLLLPRWLGGFEVDLNPGPFNIKEHTVIAIMTNVSFVWMTGLHVATAAQVWLDIPFSDSFALLLTMASQMGGFGLAGMSRRLLVWPASMIWPYNLVITTNLNTLHAGNDPRSPGISRFKFFIIALSSVFLYHFFPGYLVTCLSYFSWICWIKPDNVVVNQLFGVTTGLGMGILTFDWSQILYAGNPLNVPWWAQVNVGISFVVIYWIIVPILYYTNVWDTSYLPVTTSGLFDRFGQSYNISRIITADHKLDHAEYENYSPVYISVTYAMTFTVAFGLTTAAVVHTILHQGERIYKTLRSRQYEEEDIHARLMRQYAEVPDWWFALLLVVPTILGIVAVEINDTNVPVYSLLIAIGITVTYYFPAGFLYARAGNLLATNLIAEVIPGYMLEGSILGNMYRSIKIAKSYATQTLAGALQFTLDMKLAHYMKIPPRITFFVQIVASTVACLVSFGVKVMLFAYVDDICSPTQENQFTCPYTTTYYNSGILWGAIGPKRLFSKGSLYWPSTFVTIAGAVLPLLVWWLGRRYPRRWLRQTDLVVMFNGVLGMPPATGVNYASFLLVGFVFQYVVRHRNFAWWSKYTYVLAGALDVGTLLTALVIFLGMGLTNTRLEWSGNTIYMKTADWLGVPFRTAPMDGFGPATGWK